MAQFARSLSIWTPIQRLSSIAPPLRSASLRRGRHPSALTRYVLPASYSRVPRHPSRTHRLLSSVAGSSEEEDDRKKKRLVFLGTPDVAATCLRRLHDASQSPDAAFRVVAVVTQPPKRRKRKGSVEASPVGKEADALGVQVLCPESAKDDAFLSALERDFRPDVCITAAYGQYLPKRFLAIPPCGTINIHPSLLPRWRGASPVQRSLEAGDNPVGVTVLFTVSKMDAGPILAQQAVTIDDDVDTATTVLPRLFDVGTDLLLRVLPDVLSGRVTPENTTPQDDAAATKAAMIDSSEAELRVWKESARTCHNRCRGFSLWPQAYLTVQVGDRPQLIKLKVLATRVASDEKVGSTEPTTVVKLGPTKKDGLYVTCGDGSVLELLHVQPPTRRAFPARDFQNGYPGETIRWVRTDEGGDH